MITYFKHAAGLQVQFRVRDYLWVFIDGKSVLAHTQINPNPTTITLALDSLTWVNPPAGSGPGVSLSVGELYSMSLFYLHRAQSSAPALKWQVPGGSVCDAVTGANTTVDIRDFSGKESSIYANGGSGTVGVAPDGRCRGGGGGGGDRRGNCVGISVSFVPCKAQRGVA